MASSDKSQSEADRRSEVLEWPIAAVAGLAVLGLFGFLLFEAVTSPGTPPVFSTEATGVREQGGMHYVTVSVLNQGEKAAADARITGSLDMGGAEETASATLNYAPANSEAEVVLVFAAPVDVNALHLQVESFRAP